MGEGNSAWNAARNAGILQVNTPPSFSRRKSIHARVREGGGRGMDNRARRNERGKQQFSTDVPELQNHTSQTLTCEHNAASKNTTGVCTRPIFGGKNPQSLICFEVAFAARLSPLLLLFLAFLLLARDVTWSRPDPTCRRF